MKDGRTMSGIEAGKKNMAFEDLEKRDRMGNMRYGGVRGGWLGGCFKAEELLAVWKCCPEAKVIVWNHMKVGEEFRESGLCKVVEMKGRYWRG